MKYSWYGLDQISGTVKMVDSGIILTVNSLNGRSAVLSCKATYYGIQTPAVKVNLIADENEKTNLDRPEKKPENEKTNLDRPEKKAENEKTNVDRPEKKPGNRKTNLDRPEKKAGNRKTNRDRPEKKPENEKKNRDGSEEKCEKCENDKTNLDGSEKWAFINWQLPIWTLIISLIVLIIGSVVYCKKNRR